MRKPWQKKEWIIKRKKYVKNKSCSICSSKKYITIHHPQKNNSLSEDEYMSFEGTIILCRRCHWAAHHGKILCPQCKKHYMDLKFDVCWKCHLKEDKDKIPVIPNYDMESGVYYHSWCKKRIFVRWDVMMNEMTGNLLDFCIEICPMDINSCQIALDKDKKIYEMIEKR